MTKSESNVAKEIRKEKCPSLHLQSMKESTSVMQDKKKFLLPRSVCIQEASNEILCPGDHQREEVLHTHRRKRKNKEQVLL